MQTLTAEVATASGNGVTTPASTSTLGDFFRYHGVWAPGVRMFRRIGFRAKALVISATFMLPIVTLGWSYATLQNTSIDFSAKERLGVSYAHALLPLLPMVQLERQAAVLGSPAAGELAGKIDAQRQLLAKAEAQLGAELGTGQAFAAWTQADRAVASAGSDPDARANAHGARVGALLNLLGVSTDGSNLTLDPDIDTYYLMDAAMFRVPAMLESLSQLRATGAAVLKASQATPAQQRHLIEQRALFESQWSQLDAGLKKALAYNGQVQAAAAVPAAAKAWAAFAEKLQAQVLRSEGPSGDATAYLATGEAAEAALITLGTKAKSELDLLVQARVDRLSGDSHRAGAMVVLALLLAAYLFYCFRKVLDGGIREVAFHVNAMRDGDLTTRPRAWGADEVASLMGTLTEMQDSMRSIVSQVRGASDTLVQTSVQIDTGAVELSDRTVQAAANLEQTAAAMEQVAATVKNNDAAIQRSSQLASSNASLAERGGQIVGQVVGTMQTIHQSSGRIAEIIGTIDSIAFQTNILALNAAVEAARAGDQGRGFAVVASEVRALAQRSAGAAREIKGLITASLEQIDGGAKVAQQAGSAIGQIVGAAAEARSLLSEVAQGAREQSIGIDQTTQAVQSLDQMTQHNAALVDQTASAARALKDQALALSENVARFRLPA